ncbi:energy-coupled thiamine transporter ThiT [Jeotgalibacillus proteolyticus]|uniref:Energy-coupled thiamine transporter ThiT n=1 Tax=Jeotgalibacillus proteolyticus TaxID=2082395 RepID=A0A2S5G7J4_9BACL|nr:energy-coupled thiamine transporter ThiT [Jeotgalibacillus proteolyticus]PPA68904.1 energy-coupled thiamine transporter ThiT [Jeotgalibacillus proteolyticus]
MERTRLLFLLEVAIFSGIGLILDRFSFSIWPQGGSISFAMVPIILMAFRWGLKGGLLTGFLVGILQIVMGGAYILTPVQGALDYPVAFTVVGLAGLLAGPIQRALSDGEMKKAVSFIVVGTFIGVFLRFVCHFVAGIVFFGSGDPSVPAWQFSLFYNGSYLGPAFILTAMILSVLLTTAPRVATQQHMRNA